MNYVRSFERPGPIRRKPLVWLLLGGRAGDNNQLLALADALGFPYEVKELRYSLARRFPLLRRGMNGLAPESRMTVAPPWPDLVMAVGYASVPVARFIRQQTGGRAKLVHVGNPRRRLPDFDLQLTTPQYSRADAQNLVELPFPIGNPARDTQPSLEELKWLRELPRPHRLVAIGGSARHWQVDHGALREAIKSIQKKIPSGSLIIATSKRTSGRTRMLVQTLMNGPHQVVVDDHPSFGTLLADSDEIYVTADSVSMLSEAILSGKPVGMIPIRRSAGGRLSHWLWEMPTGRATRPDFRNFWTSLRRQALIGTVDAPIASTVSDTVDQAASLVRDIMSESAQRPRIWALLGAHAGDNDQVLALAEMLGVPFEVKRLTYNFWRHLGPRLLGPSFLSLNRTSRAALSGDPPDLTISVGYRSAAVVRTLRRRSKGRTRSIHVGFPRISPRHFDLVITTPQYPVADHPNVLRVPCALTRAATAGHSSGDYQSIDMPKPRHLLVVGGSTWFWELDSAALIQTLGEMIDEAGRLGGSVMVTTSPRTPSGVRDEIAGRLATTDLPSLLVEPGSSPSYDALLANADTIRVTADSVAMVSDAIWTAKPVALVPVVKSTVGAIITGLVDAIRPGHRAYPQDLRFFWRTLLDVGVTDRLAMPRISTNDAMRVVMDRVVPILESIE